MMITVQVLVHRPILGSEEESYSWKSKMFLFFVTICSRPLFGSRSVSAHVFVWASALIRSIDPILTIEKCIKITPNTADLFTSPLLSHPVS